MDSGQLELVRTPTDYPALIHRVITRLEPQAAERQVEIQFTLDGTCPQLSLDAQRIEQILHNLLDNALRYTPAGGTIDMLCVVSNNQCELTVRDSGAGIPSEDLKHIFERFYRADKSRSRVDGGTGLGLSIARKIAQAHDGDLNASNHPDGGAQFTLTLPIA